MVSIPTHYVPHSVYGWVPARRAQEDGSSDDGNENSDVKFLICKPFNWDLFTCMDKESKEADIMDDDVVMIPVDDVKNLPQHPKLSSIGISNLAGMDGIDSKSSQSSSYINEASVLYCLKQRHAMSEPYTRAADILVSMNPFRWIDGMYTEEKFMHYIDEVMVDKSRIELESDHMPQNQETARATMMKKTRASLMMYQSLRNLEIVNTTLKDGGDDTSFLDPHIYEILCRSYKGLVVDGKNQSILVSGESGAGKTETVKLIMAKLGIIGQKMEEMNLVDMKTKTPTTSTSERLINQIRGSDDILQAFGNAMTLHNGNSSRFSKFVKLQFMFAGKKPEYFDENEEKKESLNSCNEIHSCQLCGAITQSYVLEKSRVVEHNPMYERNFHIFYQLLAADDEFKQWIWKGLEETTVESFKYIGYSHVDSVNGKSDVDHFESTCRALNAIGIKGEDLRTLLQAITIVLQLGNVGLGQDSVDSDKTIVATPDELKKLSQLMGIATNEITDVMTRRTVKARAEVFHVPLNCEDAIYSRDALAKGIYSHAFDHLVEQINTVTNCNADDNQYVGIISLLDVFGFEVFEINRFEQLCINYANEKLQMKYMDGMWLFFDVEDEMFS